MWVIRIVLYDDPQIVEVAVDDYATGSRAIDAACKRFPQQIAIAQVLPPVQQSRFAAA